MESTSRGILLPLRLHPPRYYIMLTDRGATGALLFSLMKRPLHGQVHYVGKNHTHGDTRESLLTVEGFLYFEIKWHILDAFKY